jgi:hypothetical protein
MSKLKVFNSNNVPDTTGTHLKGYVNATYNQLVDILGHPTFPEESGDGKIQVEWVVKFEGEIFTIYDWKIYDRNYTENNLGKFNVGGKHYAMDFIDYLESQL